MASSKPDSIGVGICPALGEGGHCVIEVVYYCNHLVVAISNLSNEVITWTVSHKLGL